VASLYLVMNILLLFCVACGICGCCGEQCCVKWKQVAGRLRFSSDARKELELIQPLALYMGFDDSPGLASYNFKHVEQGIDRCLDHHQRRHTKTKKSSTFNLSGYITMGSVSMQSNMVHADRKAWKSLPTSLPNWREMLVEPADYRGMEERDVWMAANVIVVTTSYDDPCFNDNHTCIWSGKLLR
jgi:hypothetical protein